MNKSKIILTIIIVLVIVIALYSSFNLITGKSKSKLNNKVAIVGLNPATKDSLSNAMRASFNDVQMLEKGDALLTGEKTKEAIYYFKELLRDADFDMKGLARNHLIEAYEKDRQYAEAYELLYEDTKKYKVPLTHEIRVPIEERVKYLKFASEGNYDMAVMHAELSLEAEKKISNRPKEVIDRVEARIKDLKASREYIERLK